jgi:hypothetical protein
VAFLATLGPKRRAVFFDYDSMGRMELLKYILIVLDIVMSVAILSVHAYWGGVGGTKLTE